MNGKSISISSVLIKAHTSRSVTKHSKSGFWTNRRPQTWPRPFYEHILKGQRRIYTVCQVETVPFQDSNLKASKVADLQAPNTIHNLIMEAYVRVRKSFGMDPNTF